MEKIGFIGLGIMGKPMASNLIRKGYSLKVYDTNPDPVAALVELGAEAGTCARDAAAFADVIITMLPNSPHVKEAVLGTHGVLEGARSGAVLVDMSSIAPLISQAVSRAVNEKGVFMLDAPVSGGEPKAIDGTLAIMVGGPQEVFERVKPILELLGSSVTRVGDIGAGNTTKLANQVIVALNIAAMSEAMVLAAKAGVEPEKVFEAIRGGLAGSTVLDAKAPLVLDRQFNPGFRINLHIKDLANVLETSHEIGVPLPLTASVMEIMQTLRADGLGDEDHCSLIKYYEKLAHIEVERGPI